MISSSSSSTLQTSWPLTDCGQCGQQEKMCTFFVRLLLNASRATDKLFFSLIQGDKNYTVQRQWFQYLLLKSQTNCAFFPQYIEDTLEAISSNRRGQRWMMRIDNNEKKAKRNFLAQFCDRTPWREAEKNTKVYGVFCGNILFYDSQAKIHKSEFKSRVSRSQNPGRKQSIWGLNSEVWCAVQVPISCAFSSVVAKSKHLLNFACVLNNGCRSTEKHLSTKNHILFVRRWCENLYAIDQRGGGGAKWTFHIWHWALK